tara:strand:+ start:730 stop:933 length:204 start_codon:yes stop_codon:yes gene_type:complete
MSTQLKKNAENKKTLSLDREKKLQRPNIDNLVKRIMVERRQERLRSILVMFLILSGIAITTLLFTKT